MNRYQSVVGMIFHKRLIAEELTKSTKNIEYANSVSSFLEYSKEIDRNTIVSWFSLKQLNLLRISLDLLIFMFINAVVSIVNFLLIQNIVITYVCLVFLIITLFFQVTIYILGKYGEFWERKYLNNLSLQTELSIDNLLRCPVRLIASEEDRTMGVLHTLKYQDWIKSTLTPEKLENYNVLKNEYEGTLKDLLKVLNNL